MTYFQISEELKRRRSKLISFLEYCVVRVNVPGQAGHGTGFFVAPGLVLTCAHVVKTTEPGQQAEIFWQDFPYIAEVIDTRETKYPDLALLKLVDTNLLHSCVLLQGTATPGDELYTYGHSDDFPEGESATFECEGHSKSPNLIKFKEGQVRPGFSGAPLLNLITGKVCGLVKLTRGRSSDLGGRGIPADVILTEFKDLREKQQQFHQAQPYWINLLPHEVLTSKLALQNDLNHGSVIDRGIKPKFQARQMPILLRPDPPLSYLFGREQELQQSANSLLSGRNTEFYGHQGIGKTALIQTLAHDAGFTAQFPAGVFYDVVRHQPLEDILQTLFEAFYESEANFKPSKTEIRHALKDKQALILFDDLELSSEQFKEISNLISKFSFLIASTESHLTGKGQSIQVTGLSLEASISLIQYQLGRDLTDDELPAAQAIWEVLEGLPEAMLQHLLTAQVTQQSLIDLSQQLTAADSPATRLRQILASIAKPKRLVLAMLFAFAGLAVSAQSVQALTVIPNTKEILESLRGHHLVNLEGDRYRIADNLIETLMQIWGDPTAYNEGLVANLIAWIQQHQFSSHPIVQESDMILRLLKWSYETERWSEVLQLGRALESSLILGRRWGIWQQVLQWELEAARLLSDQAAESWALHQLGSRALCLEENSVARNYLEQALELRNSLGDGMGAAITRHNLNHLLFVPPAPSSPSSASFNLPKLLFRGTLASLVAASGAGIIFAWKAMQTLPPPTAFAVEIAPTNATESEWQATLTWEDGCDKKTAFSRWRENCEKMKSFRVEYKSEGADWKPLTSGGKSLFKKETSAHVSADQVVMVSYPELPMSQKSPNSAITQETYEYVHPKLQPNTNYTYRIAAVDTDGDFSYSGSEKQLTRPIGPEALTVVSADNQIELRWQDKNPNPPKFEIERFKPNLLPGVKGCSSISEEDFEKIETTSVGESTYLDKNLDLDTIYCYRVQAINDAGSSKVTTDILGNVTAPTAPSDLKTIANSTSKIQLKWEDNSQYEGGFTIERKSKNGTIKRFSVGVNEESFTDSKLDDGTEYIYRVLAFNVAGDSQNSDTSSATTPLAIPTNLKAEEKSTTTIQLTWSDKSQSETGYKIERKSGAGDFKEIAKVDANQKSFTDRKLTDGKTYTYQLRATNETGDSGYSNSAKATTQLKKPTNLQTARTNNNIKLTWSDNSRGETSYLIERKINDGSFQKLKRVGANQESFTDSNLIDGTKYTYRVRAVNALEQSDYSNASSVTIPLAAPTGLKAAAQSPNSIGLTWSDNSDSESEYIIYRATSNGAIEKRIPVGSGVKKHIDRGLKDGTTYRYRVCAKNSIGNSCSSDISSATTPLAAPTGLKATAKSPNSIDLTWSDNSDSETGYVIERATSNGTFDQITTVGANAKSHTDRGLKDGTAYRYRVRATNGRMHSNTTSAATPLAVPTNLRASFERIENVGIYLSWLDNSDSKTGYVIERATGNGSFNKIATTRANARNYLDSSRLRDGTTYRYRVRTTNGSGNSDPSNPASATTPPATPTNLQARVIPEYSATRGYHVAKAIRLEWSGNNYNREIEYEIEYREKDSPQGNGQAFRKLTSVNYNTSAYAHQAIINGKYYEYRVRAKLGNMASAYSKVFGLYAIVLE